MFPVNKIDSKNYLSQNKISPFNTSYKELRAKIFFDMIAFQYTFLHLIVLLTIFISCKTIQNKKNGYWKYALPSIVLLGLEEGMRWGREMDWNYYYYVYADYIAGYPSNHELLFQLIWRICATLGIPYYIVITGCSLFFIYSLFYLFRPNAGSSAFLYIIPLCVACHTITSSNLIRWYMALSFFLLSVRNLLDKKHLFFGVFLISSFFTHYAMAVCATLFFLIYLLKRRISPTIACAISTILIIINTKEILSHFTIIYELFSGIDRFSSYLDFDYQRIISNGSINVEEKSVLMKLITFTPYYFSFYIGEKLLSSKKIGLLEYNLLIYGSFFKILSSGLELVGRVYYVFDIFICMTFSFIFSHLYQNHKNLINKMAFSFLLFYFISKGIYMCKPLEYDEYMLYIWNEHIDPTTILNLKKEHLY